MNLNSEVVLLGLYTGELYQLSLTPLASTFISKTDLYDIQDMIKCKGEGDELAIAGLCGVQFGLFDGNFSKYLQFKPTSRFFKWIICSSIVEFKVNNFLLSLNDENEDLVMVFDKAFLKNRIIKHPALICSASISVQLLKNSITLVLTIIYCPVERIR